MVCKRWSNKWRISGINAGISHFLCFSRIFIKDFQNLVNSGIDLAIYQDKLPDAIKEFALSVNEQTKGVSDALKKCVWC
jgi:hypothetical protein